MTVHERQMGGRGKELRDCPSLPLVPAHTKFFFSVCSPALKTTASSWVTTSLAGSANNVQTRRLHSTLTASCLRGFSMACNAAHMSAYNLAEKAAEAIIFLS